MLRSVLMQQPLKILSETPLFRLGPGTFETNFGGGAALTELASELVDWRLLRYLKGKEVVYAQQENSVMTHAAESAGRAPTHPKALNLWQEYPREAIAPYFGTVFNTGSWQAGIVVVKDVKAMILLVTMDKGNMSVGGHYADNFEGATCFVWQSQTSTQRYDLRGRTISGAEPGWTVHLFLRKSKLRDGKAAPFRYAGPVRFTSWEGKAPITVHWDLAEPVPLHLRRLYGLAEP